MSEKKTTYVYACQSCNKYVKADSEDDVPVCCGQDMEVMDEIEEDKS